MTFKTIFAPVAFEATAKATVDSALVLAKALSGHVIAHHVRQRYVAYPPIDFFASADARVSSAQGGHDEAAATFSRTLRSVFEERCDAVGASIVPVSEGLNSQKVTASWVDVTGQVPGDYAMAARASDLVVTAMPGPGEHLENDLFEAILLQSGAPVLLFQGHGLDHLPSRPLIAWDGSLQASRVIRGALPLLQSSEHVTLLTIGSNDVGTPDLDAARLWLERANVEVTARRVDWPSGPIAERILNQCEATSSDLIVMGGYSHSPFYEAVVGGVTRHTLRHADKPVLMVH